MESSLKHIISSYLNFLELRTFLKFGPTEPYFRLYFFCRNSPQNKLGISERFQRILWVWDVGIFRQANF